MHQALEYYVKAGDRGLQALVHLTFCVSWDWQHDYAKALASARQALDLLQGSGDLDTQAIALNNIGYCRAHLGDYREALAWSEQALALYQELGHRSGEANAWDSVGYAHYHLGHYAQAVNCHQHALSLQESPYERSRISLALGDAHLAAGDRARAREAWQQALEILEGLHHPEAAAARARLGGTGPDRSPADSAMEIHW